MKESVEQRLKERIINVFDHYEDNTADFGWQELRKKYPKKLSRVAIWWSSAAAVVLICGVGYFLINSHDTVKLVNSNSPKINLEQQMKESGEETMKRKKPYTSKAGDLISAAAGVIDGTGKGGVTASPSAQPPKTEVIHTPASSLTSDVIVANTNVTKFNPASSLTSDVIAANTNVTRFDKAVPEPTIPAVEEQSNHLGEKENETINTTQANAIHNLPPANVQGEELNYSKKEIQPHLSIPATSTQRLGSNSPTDNEVAEKKLPLSFYAGTFVNYAEGSNNTINIGAGISTDIALSKNFTLSTGLAIAKNSLVFDEELPYSSFKSFNSKQAMASPAGMASISSISRMNAELLNLDIPVTVRYDFNPKTKKFFIAGGLTSSSYLSESYTYRYTNFNLSSNVYGTPLNEKLDMSFSKFDFAKTLNVSVGMKYDLGKTQDLTIEPFLKYPLGGLGSQNILFGAAGINLRLNLKSEAK